MFEKVYVHKNLTAAICVLAVFAAFSAIPTIIAGFINLATYEAAIVDASAGIWCGLLLLLNVFLGFMTVGTRNMFLAGTYLMGNLLCLMVCLYGIKVSADYYVSFKDYQHYMDNDQYNCFNLPSSCVCRPVNQPSVTIPFEQSFNVPDCSMFAFGKDLWLFILILVITCSFWSFNGSILGIACFVEKSKLCKRRKADVANEAFDAPDRGPSGGRGNYAFNEEPSDRPPRPRVM